MKHTVMIVSLLCIAYTAMPQADGNKSYSKDIPLLTLNPERQVSPGYIYYSAFSPSSDGINSYLHFVNDSIHNQQRWYVVNKTLVGLYQAAAHGNGMIQQQRIIFDVKDSSVFFDRKYPKLLFPNSNIFYYESVLPGNVTLKQRCDKMLQDLDSYFGYSSRFEKKKVKVWVFKRKEQIHIDDDTVTVVRGKNYYMAIDIFMREVAFYANKLVYNESGLADSIKIIVVNGRKDFTTLPALNREIERLGIYFEEEEREMKMLVISDKK